MLNGGKPVLQNDGPEYLDKIIKRIEENDSLQLFRKDRRWIEDRGQEKNRLHDHGNDVLQIPEIDGGNAEDDGDSDKKEDGQENWNGKKQIVQGKRKFSE